MLSSAVVILGVEGRWVIYDVNTSSVNMWTQYVELNALSNRHVTSVAVSRMIGQSRVSTHDVSSNVITCLSMSWRVVLLIAFLFEDCSHMTHCRSWSQLPAAVSNTTKSPLHASQTAHHISSWWQQSHLVHVGPKPAIANSYTVQAH